MGPREDGGGPSTAAILGCQCGPGIPSEGPLGSSTVPGPPSLAELLGAEERLEGSQPALQQVDSDYARVHVCVCVTFEYT